jgi:hypothetical protein
MNRRINIILITILGFSACSPIYYAPSIQNVPMISCKGEKNISLSAGSSNINNIFNTISTLDLQSAYGITNHLSFQINGGYYFAKEDKSDAGGSGHMLETGIGYFTKINKNTIVECFGIFGFGDFNNKIEISAISAKGNYQNISGSLIRLGIQPAFGFKFKSFEAALSSRMVRLEYKNIRGYLLYGGIDQVDLLKNKNSHYLFEPAISLKTGWENIKFQLQYGRSFNLTNPNFRQGKDFISIGLNFNFN